MELPFVACVMPAADRLPMVLRAIDAFRQQTYPWKRLVIFDTGTINLQGLEDILPDVNSGPLGIWIPTVAKEKYRGASIGRLRNACNAFAADNYQSQRDKPEILIHWDSDDWSAPERIWEQVAYLQETERPAVGYNEVPFLDEECHRSWLYSNQNTAQPIGSSLCYWVDTWSMHFFADTTPSGAEDYLFLSSLRPYAMATSAYASTMELRARIGQPRLIASLHDGNTSSRPVQGSQEWAWEPACNLALQRSLRLPYWQAEAAKIADQLQPVAAEA